ncbi:MAG TPA: hypothetical protein VN743_03620 [Blastocatellia bacterium]|nr:hypothetical protein [Blastocatellia bacterium]
MLLRFDRNNPLITVINQSDIAKNREVERMVKAVQRQVTEHFRPAWGLQAKLVFNEEPPLAMKVVIKDKAEAEDEGYFGYHFVDGLPVTYIFAQDDIKEHGEFSSTLSHEVLEMLADPDVNLFAMGCYRDRAGRRRPAFIPYEVCDPVEASKYKIDGVTVSNFVFPEWFEPEHEDGVMKMDYLGLLDGPFKIAPGGYLDVLRNGKTRTIWGEEAKRKKTRHRLQRRTSNRNR